MSDLHRAARALLRTPLLRAQGPSADDFRLVRRQEAELREWFDRNTGWRLRVDAAVARLAKEPGAPGDPTHPARAPGRASLPFSARRYVLFCLALAVLERGDAQTTLGRLAGQVALAAADPTLAAAGVEFTLEDRDQRADMIAVVRLLLHHGVLVRLSGDEEAYLRRAGDALYDVDRRVLAGLLAARHGPSTVDAAVDSAAVAAATTASFEERLAALTAETELDSDEVRNRGIRHRLTRRLLDDPVLYFDELTEDEFAYVTRQRGALTRRISELTGLVPEVRAEGIAMVDPEDDLTDVRMPEQGTRGHATLLLATHLARTGPCEAAALWRRVRELAGEHAAFWSKSAREPGAERELTEQALATLEALCLVSREGPAGPGERIVPRPALARYAVGTPVVRDGRARRGR